mgnify:CR=1 FL=1
MKALPEFRSPEGVTWKASPTGRTQKRMGSGVCGHHCQLFTRLWAMVPGVPSLNTHLAELSAPDSPMACDLINYTHVMKLQEKSLKDWAWRASELVNTQRWRFGDSGTLRILWD